jgi:predicted MPP superfamily phosphohydrolase
MAEHKLSIRRLLVLLLGTLAGCAVVALVLYQYGLRIESKWLEITRLTIEMPGLSSDTDEIKLVLLSDIHRRDKDNGQYIAQVISTVNGLEPDLRYCQINRRWATMGHEHSRPPV